MKDYDWADLADVLNATETTYSTTLSSDKGLRDLIMSAIKEKQQQLRGNEVYRTLIKTNLPDGDFALDIVDALTEQTPKQAAIVDAKCHYCNRLGSWGESRITCLVCA